MRNYRTTEASSDVVTVGQYQYDALGRRIKKVVTNSGTLDGTQYAYYNNRWQLLETRNGSEIVESQTLFGTQYVDEIVRWWRDGRGAMYVFQDANWNVTSTVSYMTQPLDRVRTTPYGQPTFDVEVVNGDWDDDGDTDSADGSALLDCFSVGDEGDCRIYDYDDNGTINLNDYFDLLALMPAGTSLQRQPARRTSPNRFPYAHQGLVLDEETGTYQNRHRHFSSSLRTFAQRDPLVFYDGLNTYTYVRSNPGSSLDPSGLVRNPNPNPVFITEPTQVGGVGQRCDRNASLTCNCGDIFPGVPNVTVRLRRADLDRLNGQPTDGQVRFPSCSVIYVDQDFSCCDIARDRQIRIIQHECVHICQCRRDGWLGFWINQALEQSLPYESRPSEIEARENARRIRITWQRRPQCGANAQ